MHVGAKVLNRCYFTVVAYYACFLTRRPEKNNIFIMRLYAALTLPYDSFAECNYMRPRDCYQSIMLIRGIPAT